MRVPLGLGADDAPACLARRRRRSGRSRRRRDAACPTVRSRLSDRVARRSGRRVADAAGARGRRRGRGARARRLVAVVDIGASPPRARASAAPARQAGAAGSGERLVGSADRRRDPRLDGARTHRLLRASAGGLPRRGLPRGRLEFPARVGEGSARRSADGAHRGRDMVRPGLRAEGGLRAMRRPARLLPGGVGEGARAARQGRPRREAPADGASRRPSSERPVQRRDRRGRRCPSRARAARLRRGHRGLRARGPLGGRLRRLGGVAHPRGGRRRHRRTGQVELADPQLPRLRDGRQRQSTRRAGPRAGGRVRRELPVHASSDRPRSLRTTGSPCHSRTGGASARER